MNDIPQEHLENDMPAAAPAKSCPKKLIAIAAVGLVAVLCLIVALVTLNSPAHKFKTALTGYDWETAAALYEENKDDAAFVEKAHAAVSEFADREASSYYDGKSDATSVKEVLVQLDDFSGDPAEIARMRQKITKVEASKEAYQSAQDLDTQRKYIEAIDTYRKVIEDDTENFTKARDAIEKAKDAYSQDILQQVDGLLSDGDAFSAYELISDISEDYGNEKLLSEKTTILDSAIQQACAKAEESIASHDSRAAYQMICCFSDDVISQSPDLTALYDKIITGLSAEAEEKKAQGDFTGAIALLTDSDGNAVDKRLSSAISQYRKLETKQVLAEAKKYLTIQYDSIDKKYNIVPKGLSIKYIDIGYNRNIEPWVAAYSDHANFLLYLGFRQDDWIFMEQIIVDCDGEQYRLSVDYWDRITDISGGTIAEIAMFMHFDSEYDIDDQLINLEPMIRSMVSADTVTIRFRGEGYKDVTIPKEQLVQLGVFWKVYQILEKDPTLVKELL